ncbi:MAG: hypothetical protein HC945_02550 [Nitrosarchaeum sp.]|nr:hypothetical protein [Nitrosarchaeum sp.]
METYTLIDGKDFSYQGYFEIQKFYRMIDTYFKDRHWNKKENKNFEQVTKDGRQITLELAPYRSADDYTKQEIIIFMVISGIRDVEIEVDGHKRKVQSASIYANLTALLTTDRQGYWEGKPVQYFFHIFVDKFIRKHYNQAAALECVKTCNELQDQMKSFLNMNRYLTSKTNTDASHTA